MMMIQPDWIGLNVKMLVMSVMSPTYAQAITRVNNYEIIYLFSSNFCSKFAVTYSSKQ